MSVEILARQTVFPTKREGECRISRFVGGQVFPLACPSLLYLFCTPSRLAGWLQRNEAAYFLWPLPDSPRGPPV